DMGIHTQQAVAPKPRSDAMYTDASKWVCFGRAPREAQTRSVVDDRHVGPQLSARGRAAGLALGVLTGKHAMSYKAIYAYPWDVAEIGVSAAVERFLALGLDTV